MKFFNMARKYYSPGDAGGAPPASDTPPATPPAAPAPASAPEIDYDKLAAAMVKAQTPPADPPITDQMKSEEEAREAERKIRAEVESNTKFDMEFGAFIETSALFTDKNADYFRSYVNGIEDPTKRSNALKSLVAKTAFADENLRDLLLDDDKSYVESILDKNETSIDGARAWRLLEMASKTNSRIQSNDKTRRTNGDGIQTPNYDAYLEKIKTPAKAGFNH